MIDVEDERLLGLVADPLIGRFRFADLIIREPGNDVAKLVRRIYSLEFEDLAFRLGLDTGLKISSDTNAVEPTRNPEAISAAGIFEI